MAGLAFACNTCCDETASSNPPAAPLTHCQDCYETDNAGQWGFGLDGRRLCNPHVTQEPHPAEYLRARAQLILSKAAAMDPAIGRRLTGIPTDPFWVDAITKELPLWGPAVSSSAVNWTELGTPVLAMINAL